MKNIKQQVHIPSTVGFNAHGKPDRNGSTEGTRK
jgi:hypothetical protein